MAALARKIQIQKDERRPGSVFKLALTIQKRQRLLAVADYMQPAGELTIFEGFPKEATSPGLSSTRRTSIG